MKPHRATSVLVFGIISLVVCAPLGIAAWVMGNRDLREMDTGLMDPSGRDTTSAGRICGIIGTVLFAIQIVAMLFFFFAFFVAGTAAMRSEMHRVDSMPSPPSELPQPR